MNESTVNVRSKGVMGWLQRFSFQGPASSCPLNPSISILSGPLGGLVTSCNQTCLPALEALADLNGSWFSWCWSSIQRPSLSWLCMICSRNECRKQSNRCKAFHSVLSRKKQAGDVRVASLTASYLSWGCEKAHLRLKPKQEKLNLQKCKETEHEPWPIS